MNPFDAARANVNRIARVLREAADAETTTVKANIAGRRNIVISGAIGDDGGVHQASTRQRVRIRQDGNESVEETVTTREESTG